MLQWPKRQRRGCRCPHQRRDDVFTGENKFWAPVLLSLCLMSVSCRLDSCCLSSAFMISNFPIVHEKIRASKHLPRTIGQSFRPRLFTLLTSGSGSPPTTSINNTATTASITPNVFYSSSQLQHIKDSVNIVDVIERYHLREFKRFGQDRATAVCPFHNDHNPSLSVDNTRQIYKCFACGAGGDVFHFVRQYSNQVQGQDMTFGQAVKHVLTEFVGGSSSLAAGAATPAVSSRARPLTLEQQQQQDFLRKRILLANAAAAAYYSEQLIQPTAGGARHYLLERYLTPTTVKVFGFGYAPDVYFGNDAMKSKSTTSAWGHGSLTWHLQSLNFTANELIQAGLALPTQRAQQQQQQQRKVASSSSKNETLSISATNWTFADIMDRFRGRLVVPILDATGRHILGFGGRLLPAKNKAVRMVGEDDLEDKSSSQYQPPKYLNSPESIVFEKRLVLFGHHLAHRAMKKSTAQMQPLVVVEGYMDAIALWTTGIETAVATMGTAISKEQLQAAAKLAADRIVLCLDNDAAGEAAVERLCTNGFLKDLMLQHKHIQVQVATLPVGVKDPADFIEYSRRKGSDALQVAKSFHTQVLDTAVEWTEWFLHRILAKYDPKALRGAIGSFGNIFEQVADFMAGSMTAVERTQRAMDVTYLLASILAKERNTTDVSETIRIQLESDLLDLSSRMADGKESIQRRTEKFGPGLTNVHAALARGSGPESLIEELTSKLARNVTIQSKSADAMTYNTAKFKDEAPKRRAFRPRGPRKAKSLTPNFAGFKFAHDTDAAWLGINGRKRTTNGLVLGQMPKKWRPLEEDWDYSNDPTILREKTVYFASNQYHGSHFLTDEAATAGYSQLNVRHDPDFVEKGVGVFLQQDVPMIRAASEDMLLRCLVQYSSARTSVKNSLDARKALHSHVLLEWSCPTREWLFHLLTSESSRIPSDVRSPEALRDFLLSLDECPDGAFSLPGAADASLTLNPVDETDNQLLGSLEPYFLIEETFPFEKMGHEHAELQAQESLSSLMWASTLQRLQDLQNQLVAMEQDPETLPRDEDSPFDASANIGDVPKLPRSSNQIESEPFDSASQQILVQELNEVSRYLKSLAASSKRIRGQLLDQATSLGMEGHLSTALQKKLAAQLDDHLNMILSQSTLEGDAFDSIEFRDTDDESYEDALDRMASEWGDWYDEDYYWSVEDVQHYPVSVKKTAILNDGDSEENLEDALARMDHEWAGCDDPLKFK